MYSMREKVVFVVLELNYGEDRDALSDLRNIYNRENPQVHSFSRQC